jgi:hypothetical protein
MGADMNSELARKSDPRQITYEGITMTELAPSTSNRLQRLYQALAITGIAVGFFVIAVGLYFLIARPGCCDSMNMSDNKMMEQPMDMPSMSPMPGTSPMPGAPVPAPIP